MSHRQIPEIATSIVDARKRADIDALATELAALNRKTAADLRAEWRRLFRAYPPKKLSRDLLELGVAWKLQERVLGGLSAVTRRHIAQLARNLESKSDIPKARRVSLKPGARLVRLWDGATHEISVVEDGFVWRGKTWRSLSAIARAMTGTRWSGPRFFGVGVAKAPASLEEDVGARDHA